MLVRVSKEAMVIEDGKIVFLGTNEEALRWEIPLSTKIVDTGGYTILPGMHDVHIHPLEAGSMVAGTCILPQATRKTF